MGRAFLLLVLYSLPVITYCNDPLLSAGSFSSGFLPPLTSFFKQHEAIDGSAAKLGFHWFRRQKKLQKLHELSDMTSSELSGSEDFDDMFMNSGKRREPLPKRSNPEDSYRGELEEQRNNAERFHGENYEPGSLHPDTQSNSSRDLNAASTAMSGRIGPDTSLIYNIDNDSLLNRLGYSYTYKDSQGKTHTTETISGVAVSSSASASPSAKSSDNTLCTVCFEVCNNPHSFCGQEAHSLCKGCCVSWLQHSRDSKCPSCRQKGTPTLSARLNEIISAVLVRCPFDSCSQSVPIAQIVSHTDRCRLFPRGKELEQYEKSTTEKINLRKRVRYNKRIHFHLEANLDKNKQVLFLKEMGFKSKVSFNSALLSIIEEGDEHTFSCFMLALISIRAHTTIDKILNDFRFPDDDLVCIELAKQYNTHELFIHIENAFPLWFHQASSSLANEFVSVLEDMKEQFSRDDLFYMRLFSLDLINTNTYSALSKAQPQLSQEKVNLFCELIRHKLQAMTERESNKKFTQLIERGLDSITLTQESLLTDSTQPLSWRIGKLRSYLSSSRMTGIQDAALSLGLLEHHQSEALGGAKTVARMLAYPNVLQEISENLTKCNPGEDEDKVREFYLHIGSSYDGLFESLSQQKPFLNRAIHNTK